MRKLRPYASTQAALKALDNGGRFYNIFTSAGDDEVTSAELKKAAGVFGSSQMAYLFFAMATAELQPAARRSVESSLSPDLKRALSKLRPRELQIADFGDQAMNGRSCIIEGYSKKASKHVARSLVMIPMQVGNVTSMMPVPSEQVFDVFHIYADRGRQGPCVPLMIRKGQWQPRRHAVRWGGVMRPFVDEKGKARGEGYYLEPQYYTELSA